MRCLFLFLVFALSPSIMAMQGLGSPPVPPGNPITVEKARLGQALFWDEQLSSTQVTSCGTCHIPAAGTSDPRSALPDPLVHPGPDGVVGTADDKVGSPGVIRSRSDGHYEPDSIFDLDPQVTFRRAPSTANAAFLTRLFWDARVDSDVFHDPVTGVEILAENATLERLIAEPPVNTIEMGHADRDWLEVADRVRAVQPLALASAAPAELALFIAGSTYGDLFELAFGSPGVTAPRVIMALATYLRTQIADQTPLDALLGGDDDALTDAQERGFSIFLQSNCTVCHSLPLTTDDEFHRTGVRPLEEDFGRGAISGIPDEDGMFRTPSLRNVGLREPLFHHGGARTLEGVVRFYNRGGDFPQDPFSDPLIEPLGLTRQQRADLVDFLRHALTDPRVAAEVAPFDRPQLYTESGRAPRVVEAGEPGAGGLAPELIAVEPPLLGNPNLTIGVRQGLGGAPGLLWFGVGGANLWLPTGALERHGAGVGYDSEVLAIPSDPALDGVPLQTRWFVLDPAATQGIAWTELCEFELFAASS